MRETQTRLSFFIFSVMSYLDTSIPFGLSFSAKQCYHSLSLPLPHSLFILSLTLYTTLAQSLPLFLADVLSLPFAHSRLLSLLTRYPSHSMRFSPSRRLFLPLFLLQSFCSSHTVTLLSFSILDFIFFFLFLRQSSNRLKARQSHLFLFQILQKTFLM